MEMKEKSRVIRAYQLEARYGRQMITVPERSEILSLKLVNDSIVVWFLVKDVDSSPMQASFFLYPTGFEDLFKDLRDANKNLFFVDTIVIHNPRRSPLAFHIFAIFEIPEECKDEEITYMEEAVEFSAKIMEATRESIWDRGPDPVRDSGEGTRVCHVRNRRYGKELWVSSGTLKDVARKVKSELRARGWDANDCTIEELK